MPTARARKRPGQKQTETKTDILKRHARAKFMQEQITVILKELNEAKKLIAKGRYEEARRTLNNVEITLRYLEKIEKTGDIQAYLDAAYWLIWRAHNKLIGLR